MPQNPPALDFTRATYTCAAHTRAQLPPDHGTEVAFAGRSNVGKSSAINAITARRQLARASKTPGRTQQIIFFTLPQPKPKQETDHRLVDLPGYGYANAPQNLRHHWQTLITDYLTHRTSLRGIIIPMDIRRPLTELDEKMLHYCTQLPHNQHRQLPLPIHILLTKSDKLTRTHQQTTLTQTRQTLAQLKPSNHPNQPNPTTVQLFSATKRHGIDQAREVIHRWLTKPNF